MNLIMKGEWVSKLRKFPPMKVYEAVDAWKGKYPPNIQELTSVLSVKQMHKPLPKPKCNPEIGKEHIKQMRKKLR
jgi:hypothetical protein